MNLGKGVGRRLSTLKGMILNEKGDEKEQDEIITVYNTDYRFLLGDLNFRMDLT